MVKSAQLSCGLLNVFYHSFALSHTQSTTLWNCCCRRGNRPTDVMLFLESYFRFKYKWMTAALNSHTWTSSTVIALTILTVNDRRTSFLNFIRDIYDSDSFHFTVWYLDLFVQARAGVCLCLFLFLLFFFFLPDQPVCSHLLSLQEKTKILMCNFLPLFFLIG